MLLYVVFCAAFLVFVVGGQDFRFVVLGDTHYGNGYEPGCTTNATQNVRQIIDAVNAASLTDPSLQFVVVVGDVADHPDFSQLSRTELDRLRLPYFPVIGNHDRRWSYKGTDYGSEDFYAAFSSQNGPFSHPWVSHFTGHDTTYTPPGYYSPIRLTSYQMVFPNEPRLVFLALDWAARRPNLNPLGSTAEPVLYDFDSSTRGTFPWLRSRLQDVSGNANTNAKVVLLQHFPFYTNPGGLTPPIGTGFYWPDASYVYLAGLFKDYSVVLWGDISGHVHHFSQHRPFSDSWGDHPGVDSRLDLFEEFVVDDCKSEGHFAIAHVNVSCFVERETSSSCHLLTFFRDSFPDPLAYTPGDDDGLSSSASSSATTTVVVGVAVGTTLAVLAFVATLIILFVCVFVRRSESEKNKDSMMYMSDSSSSSVGTKIKMRSQVQVPVIEEEEDGDEKESTSDEVPTVAEVQKKKEFGAGEKKGPLGALSESLLGKDE